MKRSEQGKIMAEKLAEYPQVATDLRDLKQTFGEVKLVWIKFTDGTEIGHVPAD
jgi:hypothetical protein